MIAMAGYKRKGKNLTHFPRMEPSRGLWRGEPICLFHSCLFITFAAAFLIMLSVQIMRIEKMISDLTELIEGQVEVLYGKY